MTPAVPPLSVSRRALAAMGRVLRSPPRWVRWVAAACAALLVAQVLWHGAQPYAVGLVSHGLDKLAHAALHFGLCALLLLALKLQRGWWAVALCAAVAAIDEAAQQFNPGRSVEWADWYASVAGAMLALAAAHAIAWRTEMRQLQQAQARRSALTRWLR